MSLSNEVKMSQSNSIEEAISHGDHNYWDEQILASGRSGGTRCPKCKKWTQTPRKRKNPQPVYLSDCELCEIKDPFERMWHEFNRCCDDDERKIHNQWLAEVIDLAGSLEFLPDGHSPKKMKLYKLLQKIPFFYGV